MATKIFALLTWIDKLCKLIMDKNYHHHCNEMHNCTHHSTITIKPNMYILLTKILTKYIYTLSQFMEWVESTEALEVGAVEGTAGIDNSDDTGLLK